jgi:hypothetical protein
MKPTFAIAAAFLVSTAAIAAPSDGDWWEKIDTAPGSFAPLKPLRSKYTFGWSAFTAGNAEAEYSRTREDLYQLKIKGATTGAVRALWKLDTEATSTVRPATLLPEKLVQQEAYSDESRTTTVTFSPEGVSRYRERKPPEKNPPKTKRFKFAPVHDMHSSLLFVRSQPLKQGDTLRFAVYPAAQAYLAEVTVIGRETIKAAGKKWPAIKIDLKLKEIEKDFTLAPHRKFKRASGWISDDADRLLLKVESEVMVGKVWMELEHFTFTTTPASEASAQPPRKSAPRS